MTKLQKALILILILTIQPEHGHAYRKQADQLPTANTNQFIIFQEIGEMAADLSYVHVTLPLNISTLYQQAEVFKSYLTDLANFTTDKMHRIPFAKAVRDAGQIGLRSLDRIVTNLQDIDYNLVHSQDKRRKKRELIYDALIKAIRDGEQLRAQRKDWAQRAIWKKQYSQEDLDNYETKLYINSTLENIEKLLNKPKPEYPESFWEAFSTTPRPPTTTFRPWMHLKESEKEYLHQKEVALRQLYRQILKDEKEEQDLFANTPDWYFHSRQKRNFLAAFKIINDVVGTFMGAFNAYEIRQLKSKFNNLSSGHNMLVRVTQKHEKDIQKLAKSMQQVVDVIEKLANYNPGLVNMLISEELQKFQDRVTKVTNAIQQIHHRRLSVDLLTPDQMEIMHKEVLKAAADDGLNSLVQHTSDYFQVEVTYLRNDEDLLIIVHVPCIKIKELLKIYKHLSFPIPLPMTTPGHDLTIRQAMDIQNFQNFTEGQLDNIFDMNNLEYEPVPEALFISDSTDLIAIGADDDYHVLTQLDLASCSKRNHVYLCDKLQVARTDLTQTCLGSLFLRQEGGVRAHCKFETKPIQELVFRLSDTDHVVFSPMDQSSIIKCNNGSQERVQFNRNQATKIVMGLGCELKLKKHYLKTRNTASIHIQPLQYSWSWDPFNLPSKSLIDSIHMDQVIYQLKKNIYNLTNEIINATVTDEEFNDMLSNSTFSLNSFSLFMWSMLAFNALFYLILFCYAVYIYYFRKPASPPSAPGYEMNTANQNSNSNISEIQNLLNKNPNILNDLVKLIDHTSKSNQPLALARFN